MVLFVIFVFRARDPRGAADLVPGPDAAGSSLERRFGARGISLVLGFVHAVGFAGRAAWAGARASSHAVG
ncbi:MULTISPECIES: hypothetical protein [Amycolatopsis]|uniref:Uncharacterized protein n=1 Tax=Amycolatopsis albidoflavus TaxID=102226 RepID=A0ABW5IFR9_9PSEU